MSVVATDVQCGSLEGGPRCDRLHGRPQVVGMVDYRGGPRCSAWFRGMSQMFSMIDYMETQVVRMVHYRGGPRYTTWWIRGRPR